MAKGKCFAFKILKLSMMGGEHPNDNLNVVQKFFFH